MAEVRDRESVPVSLPRGLVDELDRLVASGLFASRSEALRHGARLVVMFEGRLHARASRIGGEEAARRLARRREA